MMWACRPTRFLINRCTDSLFDLTGAGFQDMLAGVFNIGKGGNPGPAYENSRGHNMGGAVRGHGWIAKTGTGHAPPSIARSRPHDRLRVK